MLSSSHKNVSLNIGVIAVNKIDMLLERLQSSGKGWEEILKIQYKNIQSYHKCQEIEVKNKSNRNNVKSNKRVICEVFCGEMMPKPRKQQLQRPSEEWEIGENKK